MGPPRKPFLEISQRQRQRRVRALSQVDFESIRPAKAIKVSKIDEAVSSTVDKPPSPIEAPDLTEVNERPPSPIEAADRTEVNERPPSPIDAGIEGNIQSTVDSEKASDLKNFLAYWATKNNIPQCTVNELLGGLRKFGHSELPVDARTLCETPRAVCIRSIAGGNYAHYGLERALKDQLRLINESAIPDIIRININVDGLPLTKSSKSDLWPILGKVTGPTYKPFLIGAFHGVGKPGSPQEFVDEFLTEYTKLSNEGFEHKGRLYYVRLNAISADIPARNFISCFPAHNSRCGKCMQLGKTINGRRIFADTSPTLRTTLTFRDNVPTQFQGIVSPFEAIGVDMVNQFPLDYMHLLCLGVMKKLLSLWLNNMGKSKEALPKIAEFNSLYTSYAQSIPSEISRQPRSLDELARWKATEFRLFLLYLGPVVLQRFLSVPQLIHFNALNCAVRILCDPKECVRNNRYAESLMVYFVKTMELLYGEETLIYNIHNLIHLPADVLNHGSLDEFSCFPFENLLQKIKSLVKGGAQPLAQVIKRMTEQATHVGHGANNIRTGYRLENRKNRLDPSFPELEGCSDPYRQIRFPNFSVTDKAPNNCCYLEDKSVVFIEHICHRNEIPVIIGRKCIDPTRIAHYPCDSRGLLIFQTRTLSERQTWTVDRISRKGFPIRNDIDTMTIFPLIHTDA